MSGLRCNAAGLCEHHAAGRPAADDCGLAVLESPEVMALRKWPNSSRDRLLGTMGAKERDRQILAYVTAAASRCTSDGAVDPAAFTLEIDKLCLRLEAFQ